MSRKMRSTYRRLIGKAVDWFEIAEYDDLRDESVA
jgi:hypothetical protein